MLDQVEEAGHGHSRIRPDMARFKIPGPGQKSPPVSKEKDQSVFMATSRRNVGVLDCFEPLNIGKSPPGSDNEL